MGRDLDESTVAHSNTKINWPIKSDLKNDIQVGITLITMGNFWECTYITNGDKMY